MKRKRVIILGAGISGLTTAWYLSKTGVPLDIVILEKSPRAGGWMHTDHTTGFHFEKGPRTFKVDKCPSTMKLIAELGLQEEVIWSEARPHHRYLWLDGELQRFPTNPISFLFSPLTKGFIRALLTEWKRPVKNGDETVWEFVLRRFNYDVARLFFDPMVVGIFGGDIRQISIRACFPKLKAWEEQYGSVTKGFYRRMQEKKKESKYSQDIEGVPLSAIFSFRGGIEQLPQSILGQIPAAVRYNQEVKEIQFEEDRVIAVTDGEQFTADYLFCALPVKETGRLFEPHVPDISKEFSKIPSEGIAVINFGYDANVLPVQGFGYLTPTYAHEDILGVVFDSSVFSEHNRRPQETRLTIKMEDNGRTEEKYVEAALKGIRRHLGVSRMPKAISFKRTQRAIPQYGVGHLEKMAELKQRFRTRIPNCQLVGNYLQGVSVDMCVARAKEAVEEWKSSLV
ncbi:MAG: protoporphyrinogen oxidase [Verrucomicrobia bacterium]|nr:protoporphyrinogen oxidase [Verrucomicrobiota bacterium]